MLSFKNNVTIHGAIIEGGIARIPLSKGKETIVDVGDLPLVSSVNWFLWTESKNLFYAARKHMVDGKRRTIRMHRVICDARPGEIVDHVNGDGLDNRRMNLRIVSCRENNRNLPIHRDGKTVGVYHDKRRGVWEARLILGRYQSEEEASLAVKIAERTVPLPIDARMHKI